MMFLLVTSTFSVVLTVGTHCGYSLWVLTVVAGAEYYSELPTVENKHLYE